MTLRSADHSSFVIERRFSAPAARVFASWSNAEKKQRWFACHDEWKLVEYQLDFRVYGTEENAVKRPDGVVHRFRAQFLDIVPEQRIVFAYAMHVGDVRISASLVTIVFADEGKSTRMTFTEQVVFFDGHGDVNERREGTEIGLENLATELARS
ncbi:MAG TPA: SRPBCC family protein [Polyangiaceae bacterium]|nr:SRPBCC family protein [Polyangiaceae bacterium]